MYREFINLGWKIINKGNLSYVMKKEDKVLKFYHGQELADSFVYDYEPLLSFKDIEEVPKLFAYETNSYVMMEYIQGFSLLKFSAEKILEMQPAILSYYKKCIKAGWMPTDLSLSQFYWNPQQGLRVIDFTKYQKVQEVQQKEIEYIVSRDLEMELQKLNRYQYA